MPSIQKFKRLQKLFFDKVTRGTNLSTINLDFIEVEHTTSFAKFTGDGNRSVSTTVILKCFYMRNISDKQREKFGVNQDVTAIVYVSPLELEKKFGSITLPDYVRKSYSQLKISFLEKNYEIDSIIDLEPMHDGTQEICLAYQINLKTNTGNSGID